MKLVVLFLAILAFATVSEGRLLYTRFPMPQWRQSKVVYALDERLLPEKMTSKEFGTAISNAFKTWSAVIPLDFVEVPFSDKHDIIVGFGGKGDKSGNLGTKNGVAAHCEVSPPSIHFDIADPWAVKKNSKAFDLESVALHEIGHCIVGLGHSQDSTSTMWKYTEPPGVLKRTLSKDDIEGAQAIYGPRIYPPPPPPSPPSSPPPQAPDASPATKIIIITSSLGAFGLVILVIIGVVWCCKLKKKTVSRIDLV